MIKKSNILLFSFLSIGLFLIFFSFNLARAQNEPLYKIPELQIKIEGVEFSDIHCTVSDDGKTSCEIPWIAQYIKGIYKYAISVAGILAAIVLMGGGLIWLVSAGNVDRIGKAKSFISGSLIGLMILLTSYLVLYEINPNLVEFKFIKMGMVERMEGDSNAISSEIDVARLAKYFGIKCKIFDESDFDSLEKVAKKTKNFVTYNQDRRGQIDSSIFTKIDSSIFTIYFDCSSYAYFLLKCAGINESLPMFTGDIFQDKIALNQEQTEFKLGDLIGWPPEARNGQSGHVYIHVGDGAFYDAHSGGIFSINNAIGVYKMKHIIKAANKYNGGHLFIKSAQN